MTEWDEELRQFRADFIGSGAQRLAELDAALAELTAAPSDREALSELRRNFHRLAGAGGTFGLFRVSQLGLAGEEEAQRLIEEDGTPGDDQLDRWRRITAELRAAFDEATAGGERAELPPPPRARHGRHHLPFSVLVIEDDREFAATVKRVLENQGMTVQVIRSQAGARATLSARTPDALVCDILLPDGTGYDLVRWFRQQAGGDRTPVLMVSMLNSFVDKVEAIHCGAEGLFQKPLDWEEFARHLVRLMERDRVRVPRILSVEDDPDQSRMLRVILTSAGYEFRACAVPEQFEAELSGYQPDLVLMDVVLPGTDGFTLVKVMRQSEAQLTVPVIFLTSLADQRDKIAGLRSGGDDHLTKPVAPPLLLASVAAHLERARMLKTLVERDGLTGLLTHTAFFGRAGAVFSQRTRPSRQPAALVMVDVDCFKAVNDRFGHPVGDRVLKALSGLFRRRLRQSDILGRYGGEEFALVLEGLGEAEVVRLMDRLNGEFAATTHVASDGTEFRVTFSAGVAGLSPGFATLGSWAKAADDALYAAKAAGRNCIRVYGQTG